MKIKQVICSSSTSFLKSLRVKTTAALESEDSEDVNRECDYTLLKTHTREQPKWQGENFTVCQPITAKMIRINHGFSRLIYYLLYYFLLLVRFELKTHFSASAMIILSSERLFSISTTN